MSGDGLIWLVLIVALLILNFSAIYFNRRIKLPFWLSGIILGVFGPIIAFISGSLFVNLDHSSGGTGEGAGFGAAFIGLVIIANGISYLIIGIAAKIKSFLAHKNINQ
ncbi:ABC transporter permease [Niallia sp. Sow4_A1]|jgi:hypothetical protein|uniref:hypothetical protein n=1 Tax=Bacillaceae TaxID=186817 RepID=UPI0006611B08|nr:MULTISPECIES: hypothetical protein [Bacillaceae]MCF2647845.1 ABC transporter permease [Niallia circulans]MCM3364044.1 ABC transporter permease [Niallia sp. MER TA 168]REB73257.1 ABC transporter permease [Cutibacterium acnes]